MGIMMKKRRKRKKRKKRRKKKSKQCSLQTSDLLNKCADAHEFCSTFHSDLNLPYRSDDLYGKNILQQIKKENLLLLHQLTSESVYCIINRLFLVLAFYV